MIHYREALKKDWKDIKHIISLFPKQLMSDHLPSWKSFFVAEDKGEIKRKIVGCCALDIYSKRIAEIRSLVVLDSHQSKGIGTKLVKMCLRRAKKEKIIEIITITGKEKMFIKLGFNVFNNEKIALFKIIKKGN